MRLVVQRVKEAQVIIDNKEYSSIKQGFLVYLGITHTDTLEDVIKYADKVKKLRVFSDSEGKMNLNIDAVGGEFLVVSQFTLYGTTKGYNRPSFIEAAKPEHGEKLYNLFVEKINESHRCKTGIFGADMNIVSINDGPVTILIDSINDWQIIGFSLLLSYNLISLW